MMNAVLGKNVRTLRQTKHWTQQHLADAAGILLRTVQRIEKGDGGSLDSLAALAAVFDVSIDFLQTDLDALLDEIARNEEEVRRTHDLVDVKPVTCAAQLEIVGAVDAHMTHCESDDDDVRDEFAALSSFVRDMGDIWDEVDPMQRREWTKDAYRGVERLRELGYVVSIGTARRMMRTGAGPVDLSVVYVVAWPHADAKTTIAVPKAG